MPAEPKRILVIEDEPTIRDICKTVLTDEGYYTDVVENGSIGLEALKSCQYDLYLADIRMPSMGRWIRPRARPSTGFGAAPFNSNSVRKNSSPSIWHAVPSLYELNGAERA